MPQRQISKVEYLNQQLKQIEAEAAFILRKPIDPLKPHIHIDAGTVPAAVRSLREAMANGNIEGVAMYAIRLGGCFWRMGLRPFAEYGVESKDARRRGPPERSKIAQMEHDRIRAMVQKEIDQGIPLKKAWENVSDELNASKHEAKHKTKATIKSIWYGR